MEKVSIVVPMFNNESTISQLINSLIKQTYTNLELFLIDDGSTDNTLKICKEYVNHDSRIKVISQNHLGVSSARNKGIELSSGKYIYFCDADDFLENNLIEKMVHISEKEHVDLVISGYYIEVFLKNICYYSENFSYIEKKFSFQYEFRKDLVTLFDKQLLQPVWNKLYITKIIKDNKILFQNLNFGEDILFNRQYLLKTISLYITPLPLYHYIKRNNSSLTERYIKNLFEIRKKEYYEFCSFFDTCGLKKEQYLEYVSRRHIEKLIECIKNYEKVDCNLTFKEKRKKVKNILHDPLTKDCLKNMNLKDNKLKFFYVLFSLNLSLLLIFIFTFAKTTKKYFPKFFNFFKKHFK